MSSVFLSRVCDSTPKFCTSNFKGTNFTFEKVLDLFFLLTAGEVQERIQNPDLLLQGGQHAAPK